MMLNIRISSRVCAVVAFLSFPSSLALDEDAYMVLPSKIQGISLEVNHLRNELGRIETIENQINWNTTHAATCKSTTGGTDDEICRIFTSKAEQYMYNMKRAWKKEKIQHKELLYHTLLETKKTLEEKAAVNDADISALRYTVRENGEELQRFARRLDDIEIRCEKLETDQSIMFETQQERLDTFKAETQKYIVALTARLDETAKELSDVRASMGNMTESLVTQMDEQEKCQSGTVGAAAWPSRSFPYNVTVKFDPPFNRTPAFVYGSVYLDAGYVRYNARLKNLTKDLFKLEIVTWVTYDLWGLKLSWMACPN